MLGLQPPDRLGLLEPFRERIDKDRIQPVDAVAVVAEQALGAGGSGIGHGDGILRMFGTRGTHTDNSGTG